MKHVISFSDSKDKSNFLREAVIFQNEQKGREALRTRCLEACLDRIWG